MSLDKELKYYHTLDNLPNFPQTQNGQEVLYKISLNITAQYFSGKVEDFKKTYNYYSNDLWLKNQISSKQGIGEK